LPYIFIFSFIRNKIIFSVSQYTELKIFNLTDKTIKTNAINKSIFVFSTTAWVIFSDIKCVSWQFVTTSKYILNGFVAKVSKSKF